MDNGESSYRRFSETGDEDAFAYLIYTYRDGLTFYLNSFVGDLHVAEELCEDTFVLLGTKKPKNRGGATFKTWLYTIGRNIALNHLRRKKRKGEVSLDDVSDREDCDAAVERSFLLDEQKIMLHRAMKKLKPEYRQVLWLYYFEELPFRDIARIMKRTPHSAETLAYRARGALKKLLEKEGFIYEKL